MTKHPLKQINPDKYCTKCDSHHNITSAKGCTSDHRKIKGARPLRLELDNKIAEMRLEKELEGYGFE